MTPEQSYWFDLTGYLHLKQVLQGEELVRVREAADRYLQTPPEQLPDGYKIGDREYHHAVGFDRALDALAVHPVTWPIIRDHVESVITVDDNQIINAMRLLWERAKMVVEPSGAVGLAAALSDSFQSLKDLEQVAIVLTGGNVNLDQLPW